MPAAAVVAAVVAAEMFQEEALTMITRLSRSILRPLAAATLLALPVFALPSAAQEATDSALADLVSPTPPQSFKDAGAAVDAFKSVLKADDFDGLAKLLGLDAARLRAGEGVMDTFAQIRAGAAKQVVVQEPDADRRILVLGDRLWPFPFPLTKESDGQWAFDTEAGIDEIVNRRVGENELQAIATLRAYVEAQRDYSDVDHDADGVLEFAQKLISSSGETDGLYWPPDQGDGDSPAGDMVDEAALVKAKAGDGYFGYRYRILTGQGENVAGGRYDYVINGNMIAGFGLVAWPVRYGETGVHTFVVNQQGIVYEADLGADTERLASGMRRFNPGDTWTVAND